MATASGWAGQVLVRPLFQQPNLYMHTLNALNAHEVLHA